MSDFPKWNNESPNQFNPMHACKHPRPSIAILEALDALRAWVTQSQGMYGVSNQDFAALLRVAANSAEAIE